MKCRSLARSDDDVREAASPGLLDVLVLQFAFRCHTGCDDQINNPLVCAEGSFVRLSGYLSSPPSRRTAFLLRTSQASGI